MEHQETWADYHEPQPVIQADLTPAEMTRWAETRVSPRPRTPRILDLLYAALDPAKEV